MPIELEAKYRCADPTGLRRELQVAGARSAGTVLELNRLFDTPEGRLRGTDCGLRIRTTHGADGTSMPATLTYKGPRGAGPHKARNELESSIGDPAAVADLLGELGFHAVVTFEKRRETWHLDAAVVTLDELPQLGWFAEIEAPTAAAIEDIRTRLKLPATDEIHETYVELAARHGQPDGHGGTQLRFDTQAP